jgi:hypothetical protein
MPTDFLSSVLALDVEQDGVLSSPRRKTWSLVGFTVADDPANKRKIITADAAVVRWTTVRYAATDPLPANTQGGSTLTANANGALSVDGSVVIVGDTILVAAEADAEKNGIYTVVAVGSAGTPFVLTRSDDFSEAADYPYGLRVYVDEGAANTGSEAVFVTAGTIVLNTTDLEFAFPFATKTYVDAVAQGLQIKEAARLRTTGNVTLSGEQTIDGVLTSADRVLVAEQTDPSENGVYVTGAGAWARATDCDTWDELISAFVFVEEGSTWANSGWVSTTTAGGILETTAIVWAQFSGAGTFTAGAGLDLAGGEFSFEPIVAQSVLANATGSTAVPLPLTLAANTFLARSASGNVDDKAIVEPMFGFLALTLGAADTVPQVNGAGTAIEYAKIGTANIDAAAAITPSQLADLTGLSLLGRSASSSGVMAAITGTANQVPFVNSGGTSLGFGLLTSANIDPSAAITLSKLEPISALSVVANATNASAVPTAVAAASDHQVFRRSGAALAFGAVNLASGSAVTGLLPFANIADGSALSVLGRSANSAGVMASIAGTDGQVLRVSGTTLAFGTIAAAGITDGTITLAKLAAGTDTGNMLWWNGSAWAETTTFETDGTKIYFGAAPSTSGNINFSNNDFILSGKRSNAVDAALVVWDVTDDLIFGSPDIDNARYDCGTGFSHLWYVNSSQRMSLSATTATIGANTAGFTSVALTKATGGAVTIAIAGGTEYTANATTLDGGGNTLTNWASLAVSSHIAIGTDPADAGAIRLANSSAGAINFEANPAGSDIGGLALLTSNELSIGGITGTYPAGMISYVATGGAFEFRVNNGIEYTLTSATFDGNQNSLTDWSLIELGGGTMPAISLIRVATNSSILGAKSSAGAGSVDVPLLVWTSADVLTIGSASGASVIAGMTVNLDTAGIFTLQFEGSTQYTIDTNTFDGNQNSLTDWSLIELGTTPATSGQVRLGNNSSIQGRNAANTLNAQIVGWSTSNVIQIGQGTVVAHMRLDVATGGTFFIGVNDVDEYTLNATTFNGQGNTLTNWASGAFSSHIALGATPAGAGAIRLTNNTFLDWKSSGGVDLRILGVTGSNELVLGVNDAALTSMRYIVGSGAHNVEIGAAVEYSFSNTTFDCNQNSITDVSFIEVGPSVLATIGAIRVPNDQRVIVKRNAGNTGNIVLHIVLLSTNAADRLYVGMHDDGTTQITDLILNAGSGNTIFLDINATARYTFSATGADFLHQSLTQVNLLSAEANNTVVLETAYLGSARRVTALNRGAAITTTQMPTNTGDLVTYIGNCATAPTAAPVSGAVLYVESGATKINPPSGFMTEIAPA